MVQVALKQAELEAKPLGDLTTDDRINLSACYNRLGRYNDAKDVLAPADQNHFMVQANLAYAYAHITNFNFMDRAISCQQEALAIGHRPGRDGARMNSVGIGALKATTCYC